MTDEQFTAIIDHNGVVGLNLYANFLGERADLDTAIAHLEHWLELGGERTVALGGDLDGCSSLPEGSRVFRIWTGCGSGCCSGITVRRWCAPCFLRI